MTKTVLFHRRYRGFQGGHLKVFDYFGHVNQSPHHRAEIFLTPDSLPDHLWHHESNVVCVYEPEKADILFLAGRDWTALDSYPGLEEKIPVINLIQHVRHASPEDPRYHYLSQRAIRICVSPEVAHAVEETGRCNGPVHVVPNGIDLTILPCSTGLDVDVFIGGLKRPELASELAVRLRARDLSIDCVTSRIDRDSFLARMSRARIAVHLPDDTEGFYLPALEAMAMGRPLVCLDAIGNRSFCKDGETCLMPAPNASDLEGAVVQIVLRPHLAERLRLSGLAISKLFGLPRERSAFLSILDSL